MKKFKTNPHWIGGDLNLPDIDWDIDITFGQPTAQKWLDLAETLVENFHFWAPGPLFRPKLAQKPTGQPREPKNVWIWLNVMSK